MNILICGKGVVGGTLGNWIRNKTDHDVHYYDPPKGIVPSVELKFDAKFICCPVPTNEGGQDLSMFEDCYFKYPTNITFVRSTVLPGTNDKYGTISMPEFLTERKADEDMEELPIIYGSSGVDIDDNRIRNIIKSIFADKVCIQLSNIECELGKYMHNIHGAMKVTFSNVMHDICKKHGARYYMCLLAADTYDTFHMDEYTQVPGPDGKRGYGGKCFPKDLKAFNAQNLNPLFTVIDVLNKGFRNEENL